MFFNHLLKIFDTWGNFIVAEGWLIDSLSYCFTVGSQLQEVKIYWNSLDLVVIYNGEHLCFVIHFFVSFNVRNENLNWRKILTCSSFAGWYLPNLVQTPAQFNPLILYFQSSKFIRAFLRILVVIYGQSRPYMSQCFFPLYSVLTGTLLFPTVLLMCSLMCS